MEIYVLVPVQKSFVKQFFGYLCLALAIGSMLLACINPLMILPLCIFGVVGYCLTFSGKKEFEYSYFDGDVRFAKVMNKSRRKNLASYTMEEVMQIAPAGDRSVYKYETDSSIKAIDYTSHKKGVPFYVMAINKNGKMSMIKFEPDDRLLDAMMVKYASKEVRRPAVEQQ